MPFRAKRPKIEYSWNLNHEDLAGRATFIPSGANPSDGGYGTDHGTAVLGELVGKDNGFGVTGLIPNASVAVVNHTDHVTGYNPAKAIDIAAANMTRGDVMLLEIQTRGWNCPANLNPQCYVPIEWDAGVFAAIQRATAAGIILVEAAGNGNQNLDDPYYASRFGRTRRTPVQSSSAPAAPAAVWGQPLRSRLSFSTYGSRVNVQGWGECVTTTGYGDLFGADVLNSMYTDEFGGTSGASPIVTAAAASLSSAVETARGVNLTSTQVRSILMSTGNAAGLHVRRRPGRQGRPAAEPEGGAGKPARLARHRHRQAVRERAEPGRLERLDARVNRVSRDHLVGGRRHRRQRARPLRPLAEHERRRVPAGHAREPPGDVDRPLARAG